MKVIFNPLAAEFQLAQDASEIRIADAGSFYQTKTVEGALQEIGSGKFARAGARPIDAPHDGNTYGRKNGAWTTITAGGGTWGSITGTLSDQTDLQSALDAKQDDLTFPLTAANGGTGIANGASATLTLPNLAITLDGGGAAQTYTLPAAGGTFALLNAANVFTTQQMVNGTSDQIQLRVQGHSTQTNYAQTWESSAAAVLAGVRGNGGIYSNVNNTTVTAANTPQNQFTVRRNANLSGSGVYGTEIICNFVAANFVDGSILTGNRLAADYYSESADTTVKAIAVESYISISASNIIGGALIANRTTCAINDNRSNVQVGQMIGMDIFTSIGTGGTSNVITSVFGLNINTPTGTQATPVNVYGLFIDDLTQGSTINAAVYTKKGKVSLLGSETYASAAGATWNGIELRAATATITGSTNITTATGFNYHSIAQPTLSAASALTVNNSATLYIANAPAGAGAGPATITNAYALWVDAGLSRFDGGIDLSVANIQTDTTTGTKIGTATTQKLGFWNVTPIIQPAGAAQAAPAAYVTGAFGLDSGANMQALYDLVVAMRTALVNSGIMKGAA